MGNFLSATRKNGLTMSPENLTLSNLRQQDLKKSSSSIPFSFIRDLRARSTWRHERGMDWPRGKSHSLLGRPFFYLLQLCLFFSHHTHESHNLVNPLLNLLVFPSWANWTRAFAIGFLSSPSLIRSGMVPLSGLMAALPSNFSVANSAFRLSASATWLVLPGFYAMTISNS